jgi:hypothetical protein
MAGGFFSMAHPAVTLSGIAGTYAPMKQQRRLELDRSMHDAGRDRPDR